jgi:LPXTG-site transpeptidase (sortase) family protein
VPRSVEGRAGSRDRSRGRVRRGGLLPVVVMAAVAALTAGCGGTGAGVSVGQAVSAPASSGSAPPDQGGGSASPTATALARSVPVRLRIPEIGVDTSIVPLGLASDGTVEVPPIEAHSPAGWYDGSPTPGQLGPSVILGHVTVGQYGDGVFLRLDRLKPGERVDVLLQDRVSATFTVDSVRTVAKDRFPTQEVYGNVGRPELRLITCGGPRTSGGYLDNVVVFASLTTGS